jgi:anti-anti-sigma factor
MDAPLHIVPDSFPHCDYFALNGTIDAHAEQLLKELPTKVTQPVVRLDFSKAGRINSMGIALLLRCCKTIRDQKRAEIQLAGLNQMNTLLFKMTGMFLLATPSKS